MIKPLKTNKDNVHFEEDLLSNTVFTPEELIKQVSSGIVEVYADDGQYVALMPKYDYDIYNRIFDNTVESDALDLYLNQRDNLQKQYPGSTIQGIIGYVLSQRIPPQY